MTAGHNALRGSPLHKEPSTYDNIISDDGNFWSGGAPAAGGQTIKLLDIRAGKLAEFELSRRMFADGNAWFGGRGGSIVELDTRPAQGS